MSEHHPQQVVEAGWRYDFELVVVAQGERRPMWPLRWDRPQRLAFVVRRRDTSLVEFVFFPFLVIAQALPMVLAVVVGIALARWLGLFEPRGAQNGPRLRGRGLVVALGAVALVLLLVGLFFTPV